jgi:type IV fimbrial biogenesis protein FimT
MNHRHATSLRSAARGLTLVEACVVLAIAAILGATAAPSLRTLLDTRRVERAATTLAADLHFVRGEAVTRNQTLALSLHPTAAGSCYVVHSGAPSLCTCAATGPASCAAPAEEIRTVHLPSIDRVALIANVSAIRYDPLHGTSTPTGTLRLVGADGRAVHHVVNLMGRVRSCSPQAAVPGYREC